MAIGRRIVPTQTQNVEPEVIPSNKVADSTNKRQITFEPQAPKYTMDQVILPEKTVSAVKQALVIKDKSDLIFEKWGLNKTHKFSRKVGINLYGLPGTGKTMVAHAIAHYLNKKLIVINYADIESKFVGDTPKNLTAAFQAATETDSILFFDEADAILSRRVTNMNNATDTSVNQTRSVMLTLLNDYQGVILFATNYISNFDPAFMRRILAHIQFELPDYGCRVKLYERLIPKELPTDVDKNKLAERFDGVSGSDISNAILLASFKGAQSIEAFVKHEFFEEALEGIKKSQAANRGTENVKVETRLVSEEYAQKQIKNGGSIV